MKAEWANQAATIPASGTEKSITPAGGVSHSTSKAKIGNSSIRHTSSNGVLNIADHDDWDFGTNFTVEGWFRFDDLSNKKNIIAHNGGSNSWGNINFYMQTDTNNVIQVGCGNAGGSGVSVDSTTQVSVDTWYHIAMIKEGNTLSVAINGTIENSATGTMAPNTGVTNPLWVGSGGAGGNLEGYSDEIRVSDVARYTADFTPSTTAFTSDANTLLLIHSDETDDGIFQDSSSNSRPISVRNTVERSTTQKKFGDHSIYFGNGNNAVGQHGNGISIPDSDDFHFGTNDFTLEGWFYLTAMCSGTGGANNTASNFYGHSTGNTDGASAFAWAIEGPTGANRVMLNGYKRNGTNTNDDFQLWSNTALTSLTNQWIHLAAVRDGTTIRLYLNGVEDGNMDVGSGDIMTSLGSDIWISKQAYDNGYGYINGYMDDYRVSNTCRYPNGTTFTPNTSPHVSDANTLLLINDKSSKSFTDSSSKNHTITPQSGNKHEPIAKKIGDSSIMFDGTGDKLEVAANAAFEVAPTDPYTIEFWFKMNKTGSNTYPQRMQFMGGGTWASSGTPTSWVIDYQHNTNSNDQYIRWARYGTNASYTWGNAVDTNWHHLAIVMPGDGTQKLYLDGTHQASASVGDTWHTASDPILIGMSGLTGQDMNGYMDEIRISSVARYSADFTPSTTAFTSDADTLLLIHSDETDGSIFQDSSSHSRPISVKNTVEHSTTQKKFGDTSIYFGHTADNANGTHGNAISIADSDDFHFGSNDFTIEGWFYFTNMPRNYGGPGNLNSTFFGHASSNTSDAAGGFNWNIEGPTGAMKQMFMLYRRNGTNSNDDIQLFSNTALSGYQNQWVHLAAVRDGSKIRLYLNGVEDGNTNISGDLYTGNYSGDIWISRAGNGPDQGYISGYMDDYRVSNTCRYPNGTTFTPNTSPHVSDANTLVLINDGSSQSFTDSSSNAHTITATGNTQHQPPVKKIGNSSIMFDGSGDCLTIPASNAWWDVDALTIEMWAYWNNTGVGEYLIANNVDGNPSGGYGWYIAKHSNNALEWSVADGNGNGPSVSASGLQAGQWYHVAAIWKKSGTEMELFLDGVSQGKITNAPSSIMNVNIPITIGGNNQGTSHYMNGYVDEVRISNVARYTSNFTPSTTAFTSDANTTLLIHGASTSPFTETSLGGTALSYSHAGSNTASKAFDNDTGTYWIANETAAEGTGISYIGYDAGAGNSFEMSAFSILGRQNGNSDNWCSNVIVRYSDDGTNWTNHETVALSTTYSSRKQFLTVASGAGSHRYWSLLANADMGASSSWGVAELKFYEGEPFTDTSVVPEVVGKSAQLHGWAVNY